MEKQRLFSILASLALIALGTWGQIQGTAKSNISEEGLNELFHQVLYYVENEYVEKTDKQKVWFGAIKGALKALDDEHTRFMTPESHNELRDITRGSFGGLGIEITIRDSILTVISPIEGTPAMRAGIQPGDKIIEINKKPTRNISLEEAVKIMRGAPGTSVNLSIAREKEEELLSIDIIRDIIKIKIVKTTLITPQNIGYIRLKQFAQTAFTEVSNAVKHLEKQKVKGLILDLRYNAGGLLEAAYKISNLFLTKGVIVSTRGRSKQKDGVYKVQPELTVSEKTPLVILVNEGSASASEIVTGAIKDHKRGTVIGVKTFGKGSVQKVIPLSHDTAIALTIQKYYTPSGKSIHKVGIDPNIEVKSLEFNKKDLQNFKQIKKKKLLSSFVKENPGYNKANVKKFKKFLIKSNLPLSDFAVKYSLKDYVNRKNINKPVIDLEFDVQLKRAIKHLQNKS